ncbi:C4-dicarboxylate ABC transporter [Streptomyces sp. AJS327]|uniref:SLAC1 family transporter n=1 Tax=Streptomyces sp. AJS327 TaxID=2545265 RepID=UPI0015DF8BF3|nr:C4-dicarboxylate ABC transporter [Streptomyces sp. AJS327]MBA0050713.1 C4-dicarboxylate ABC transporter [Streptomyces sp. AJS327]
MESPFTRDAPPRIRPRLPWPRAAERAPGGRVGGGRLGELGPNWYAPVMGTSIVPTAAAALPVSAPRGPLLAVWSLAALMLVAVVAARAAHWARYPARARAHLLDPAVAPFYGCASMAPLAVGAGALALDVPGALPIAVVLGAVGTAVGLVAAGAVPYLMVVRHRVPPGSATPVWLLPVVAPMVAAALAPELAQRLPEGQARGTLLLAALAMFGLSLLATLLILPLVFARLVHHGPLPGPLTPSLFLVLGPLGQSTTALAGVAGAADGSPGAPSPSAAQSAAVLYGAPVLGFALLWLGFAGALVLRAARSGMGFAMTWWSFTFPVGTCVTGSAALWRHTGAAVFGWLSCALFALLLAAWATVLPRTAYRLFSGALPPAPRPAPVAPPPVRGRTTSDGAR